MGSAALHLLRRVQLLRTRRVSQAVLGSRTSSQLLVCNAGKQWPEPCSCTPEAPAQEAHSSEEQRIFGCDRGCQPVDAFVQAVCLDGGCDAALAVHCVVTIGATQSSRRPFKAWVTCVLCSHPLDPAGRDHFVVEARAGVRDTRRWAALLPAAALLNVHGIDATGRGRCSVVGLVALVPDDRSDAHIVTLVSRLYHQLCMRHVLRRRATRDLHTATMHNPVPADVAGGRKAPGEPGPVAIVADGLSVGEVLRGHVVHSRRRVRKLRRCSAGDGVAEACHGVVPAIAAQGRRKPFEARITHIRAPHALKPAIRNQHIVKARAGMWHRRRRAALPPAAACCDVHAIVAAGCRWRPVVHLVALVADHHSGAHILAFSARAHQWLCVRYVLRRWAAGDLHAPSVNGPNSSDVANGLQVPAESGLRAIIVDCHSICPVLLLHVVHPRTCMREPRWHPARDGVARAHPRVLPQRRAADTRSSLLEVVPHLARHWCGSAEREP
mmetsp:Transcript_33414/g.92464  ORF Transcript_33414/g.92464 Transcript_33414/m.92464 type:complete len:496 (-) Transcript_33414:1638-3125(-)